MARFLYLALLAAPALGFFSGTPAADDDIFSALASYGSFGSDDDDYYFAMGSSGGAGSMGSFAANPWGDIFGDFDTVPIPCSDDQTAADPVLGFQSCDEAFLSGYCTSDTEVTNADGSTATIADGMAIRCKKTCSLCPGDAAPGIDDEGIITAPPAVAAPPAGECDYVLHIESKAWAEDISWSIDAGKADEVGGGSSKYSDYSSYDIDMKLKPGLHQLVVQGNEQYREGWNSGTYTISQNFGDKSIVVPNTPFGISSPAFGEYGGPSDDQEQGFRGVVDFSTVGCGAIAAAEAAAPVPVTDEARDAEIAAAAEPAVAAVVVAPTGPCGAAAAGPLQIQLEVHTENWSSDISWNLDGTTEVPQTDPSMMAGPLNLNQHTYLYSVSLEPGPHVLTMLDMMGDTWNPMNYDDGTPQGYATITLVGTGAKLVDHMLMPSGKETFPVSFAVPFPPPCPVAADPTTDDDDTLVIDTGLPPCMSTCANQPTDASVGSKCHFTGQFESPQEEACMSGCDFEDAAVSDVFDGCSSLTDVFAAVSTGAADPTALDAVGVAMQGSYGGVDFGSIVALTAAVAIQPEIVGGAGSLPPQFAPVLAVEVQPEIVGGAGSLPPQPVAVVEPAPVEIVGGAGSYGSYSALAPTFDDDWFITGASTLLMASKSTELSSQTSKSGTAVTAAAVVVGVVALLAVALVVMRRSSSEQPAVDASVADSMALTPGTPCLKALPENAADLI